MARKQRKQKLIFSGVVEGDFEKLYLEKLKSLVNTSEKSRYYIDFELENPIGGDPYSLAKRACRQLSFYRKEEGLVVCIFDYDNKEESFKKALVLCRQNKVIAAYSNFSFELWLILHKKFTNICVNRSEDYKKELKTLYHINEENIKSQRSMRKIIESITLEDIIMAIHHAERLMKNKDAILYNNIEYYQQPSLSIHIFIKEILRKCRLIDF